MAHAIRNIIGSTFIFASLFNAQLTYNRAMYETQPAKVEARVRDMHTITDPVTKSERFFSDAYAHNLNELGKFYGSIR